MPSRRFVGDYAITIKIISLYATPEINDAIFLLTQRIQIAIRSRMTKLVDLSLPALAAAGLISLDSCQLPYRITQRIGLA